ncbi:MAG: PKD domain-containing protein [Burkholderiales bacterium]
MRTLKHIYRPLALAIGLMFLNPSPADAARVLLMLDAPSSESTILHTALSNAGHQVTAVGPEYTYSLAPALSNFDVVVHLNGATYDTAMPVPTQEALVQFVRSGGGFVGAQFLGFEEWATGQINMSDLVLMSFGSETIEGCASCKLGVVPGQEGHPVMKGIPASTVVNGGFWDGSKKNFAVNPPTALMKINNTSDAVLVRQLDQGRVVNFTAGVNFEPASYGFVLQDHPPITQLYVNAVSWVSARANSAPTAVIAPVTALHVGKTVTVDGSGSVDPDGNAMKYRWTLTRPPGSVAELSDPSAVMPTFAADKVGVYSVQLIVNDGTVDSTPVTATISPTNGVPSADAGPDQLLIMTGSTVQLNGSNSSDPDGDSLTYSWKLVRPSGSAAELVGPGSATPTFRADVNGTYVATLEVNDRFGGTSGDEVTVTFDNLPPIANAGPDQVVGLGNMVIAQGSASDRNGDRLTHRWSMSAKPAGSLAALAGADTLNPSFNADMPGTFVLQLIANDGRVDSEADPAVVEVITTNDATTQAVQELIAYLNGLPNRDASGHKVFKSKYARRVLVHELMEALRMIKQSRFRAALALLSHNEKRAMDGCFTGKSADRNDLIRTCKEQSKAYEMLNEAIGYLAESPNRAPRLDRNKRVHWNGRHDHHGHR